MTEKTSTLVGVLGLCAVLLLSPMAYAGGPDYEHVAKTPALKTSPNCSRHRTFTSLGQTMAAEFERSLGQANKMPPEEETALGRAVLEELGRKSRGRLRQTGPHVAYIRAIGSRLARHAKRKGPGDERSSRVIVGSTR